MISLPLAEFSHLISTHPVLFLSSRRGRANTVTPLTWYMPIGADPPMIAISLKPSTMSYHYVRESGDFVLGVPSASLLKAIQFCGVHSGRDMDKLRHLNLTTARAKEVSPLWLTECIAQIECRVREISTVASRPLINSEVLYVGVHEAIHQDGWNPESDLVYYAGDCRYRISGNTYDMSSVKPGYVPPDSIG